MSELSSVRLFSYILANCGHEKNIPNTKIKKVKYQCYEWKKKLIVMFKTGKVHMENKKTCFIHKFNVAYFQEKLIFRIPVFVNLLV